MSGRATIPHSVASAGLADILERVLDKGIVITGDIKIKLVDIELLTIQIRLVIASVDKAREMGMDWWSHNSEFSTQPRVTPSLSEIDRLNERIHQLEVAHAAR